MLQQRVTGLLLSLDQGDGGRLTEGQPLPFGRGQLLGEHPLRGGLLAPRLCGGELREERRELRLDGLLLRASPSLGRDELGPRLLVCALGPSTADRQLQLQSRGDRERGLSVHRQALKPQRSRRTI